MSEFPDQIPPVEVELSPENKRPDFITIQKHELSREEWKAVIFKSLKDSGFREEYIPGLTDHLSRRGSLIVLKKPESSTIEQVATEAENLWKQEGVDVLAFHFEGEVYMLPSEDSYVQSKQTLVDQYLSYQETARNRKKKFTELFGDVDVDAITQQTSYIIKGRRRDIESRAVLEVENLLQSRFPRTYHMDTKLTWGEYVNKMKSAAQKDLESLDQYIEEREIIATEKLGVTQSEVKNQPFSEVNSRYYFHEKEDKPRSVVEIAAFLKGAALDEKNVTEDVEKNITGKKILILGDDTGSLSEILNSLGASAYGVEYEKIKVLAAQTGIFAENEQPQKQVIQGDVGDLLDQNSELFGEIQNLAPFDAIYSDAVFNIGSGIEQAFVKFGHGVGEEIEKEFGQKLTDSLMDLLSEKGFCLHGSVDLQNMFGVYGSRHILAYIGLKRSYSYTSYAPDLYGSFGTGHDNSLIYIPKSKYMNLKKA